MDYDVLAFAGRFQPFHLGHKHVIDAALKKAKTVVIVLGSHEQPRNSRNPFTTDERARMITAVYQDEVLNDQIRFVYQHDHRYNDDRWVAGIQTGVGDVAKNLYGSKAKIGLVGHSKDHTSYYLNIFPTWGSVSVDNLNGIDATAIRNDFFSGGNEFARYVPKGVEEFLRDFRNYNKAYDHIQDEMAFITDYKSQFASLPYPPIFQTTDAVVVQSGHILLIKRGAMPGKGLWALPGGFLNANERIVDGCIRELREETRIALSDETLRRCIANQRTFDDPNRSLRGRTITTAFLIELRPEPKLTRVKGSDDAAKAKWVPLSEVTRSVMFEDHFDIIQEMVGI